MPLIAQRDKREKTKVNEEILTQVHSQMIEYCKWAGIADMGYFIEEAAKYVFANDLRWQDYLESMK